MSRQDLWSWERFSSSVALCRIGCLSRAKCQVLLSQLHRALTRKPLLPPDQGRWRGFPYTFLFFSSFIFSWVKMAHYCNPTVICSLACVHLCVKLLVGVWVCVRVFSTAMYKNWLREYCWELTCPGIVHARLSAAYINIYSLYLLVREMGLGGPHRPLTAFSSWWQGGRMLFPSDYISFCIYSILRKIVL